MGFFNKKKKEISSEVNSGANDVKKDIKDVLDKGQDMIEKVVDTLPTDVLEKSSGIIDMVKDKLDGEK